jgi:hypothetical protein
MRKCVEDIYDALKNISVDYLNINSINSRGDNYAAAAEHAFAAELYHQYKLIMKDDEYYKDLLLHFDLTKERFISRRPDLVLHQKADNRDDQRMYVEIKTRNDPSEIRDDLRKMFEAISPDNGSTHLGFKTGVMILGKLRLDSAKSIINRYCINHSIPDDAIRNCYLINFHKNGNEYTFKKCRFDKL